MKLRFLGTGTSHGVPMIGCECTICTSLDTRDRRLRSSIMVSSDDSTIVIDCGPDFRQQIIAARQCEIDALFLTHEHSDHVAGLDDIRAVNYKMGRAMPIYLDERTKTSIQKRFHYAFDVSHSGVPQFEVHTIRPNDVITIGEIQIEVLRVNHGKLPILGYRLGDLVYLTDVKTLPSDTLQTIKSCKTLVVNALRLEPHPAHLSLSESLNLIEQISPDRAYISHISHHLHTYEKLEEILPNHVFSAYDGLELAI